MLLKSLLLVVVVVVTEASSVPWLGQPRRSKPSATSSRSASAAAWSSSSPRQPSRSAASRPTPALPTLSPSSLRSAPIPVLAMFCAGRGGACSPHAPPVTSCPCRRSCRRPRRSGPCPRRSCRGLRLHSRQRRTVEARLVWRALGGVLCALAVIPRALAGNLRTFGLVRIAAGHRALLPGDPLFGQGALPVVVDRLEAVALRTAHVRHLWCFRTVRGRSAAAVSVRVGGRPGSNGLMVVGCWGRRARRRSANG